VHFGQQPRGISPSAITPPEGGMTKVVDIERIRWAHLREGLSVREMARAFHVSCKTVRKAIADPGP
jgi:hypothetical protein